jgi:hypothetical protein
MKSWIQWKRFNTRICPGTWSRSIHTQKILEYILEADVAKNIHH